jgi:hypothetical protein
VPAGAEPGSRAGEAKACPSGPCEEGALLLGVMTGGGTVAYVQPPTRVDADFVARARALGRPESRFRFSTPCSEGGCPQWTGNSCAVIDNVLEEEAPLDTVASGRLPRCAIRSTCRWFSQRGPAACAVCPLVVADTGGTATYQSTLSQAVSAET